MDMPKRVKAGRLRGQWSVVYSGSGRKKRGAPRYGVTRKAKSQAVKAAARYNARRR